MQHGVGLAQFDDASAIHDGDPVCQVFDHAEIVRNEQVGDAKFVLKLAQQVQNLSLDGNVERRRGFVADQHFGFNRQRPGNRNALALAAGKFVRIARERVDRQPHPLDQLRRVRRARFLAHATAQRGQTFVQDVAHPHAGIQ